MNSESMRDDPTDAVRAFIKLIFDNLSGLAVSSMIYLGHHLGLYAAMQDGEPTDSTELARRRSCTSAGCANGCRGRPRRG